MYEFQVVYTANLEGRVIDAWLQGRARGTHEWLHLRPLILDVRTGKPYNPVITQEDLNNVALVADMKHLETLVKDLEIAKNDAYRERNLCVAGLAAMARLLGYRVGIADHQPQEGEEWDDEWRNVLFIDLPTGQVSWHLHISEWDNFSHLPAYPDAWDGHDTPEKYQRLQSFIARMPSW